MAPAAGASRGSIEHTAPLAPGSSGGPILDADGRFLGLNTNRLGEGFYLALPADAALRRGSMPSAAASRSSARGWASPIAPSHVARRLRRSVGLPERDGLLVRGVEDGSPAARAGIAEGDLIVAVAGKAVTDADELVEAIAAAAATVRGPDRPRDRGADRHRRRRHDRLRRGLSATIDQRA